MNLLLLGLLWIIWCTMHSLMISLPVIAFFRRLLGDRFRYYRLFYTVTACVSLVPLLVLTRIGRGDIVISWQGPWQIGRFILLVTASLLFWTGAQRYDMRNFLGIEQIRSGKLHRLLSETEEFAATGVFSLTRHPWYLGSLLLIWSILPAYSPADLLVSAILSGYLIIGTVLEERKLVAEYGEKYRRYQRQVSMLLPCKWRGWIK